MITYFQKFLFRKQLSFSVQQEELLNYKKSRISNYKRLIFFFLFILILAFISSSSSFDFREHVQASIIEERQLLERQLKEVEKEIAQLEGDIEKTRQERKTLNRQLSILRNQIKKLNLHAQENRLMIRDLGLQVVDTEGSIEKISLQIEQRHQRLSNLLRLIYKEGQKTTLEIFLAEDQLSDFFDNLIALNILSSRTKISLKEVRELKDRLEKQKQILEQEKGDIQRILKIQIFQAEETARKRKEQEHFLRMTEIEYQRYISEKVEVVKRAAEIIANLAS